MTEVQTEPRFPGIEAFYLKAQHVSARGGKAVAQVLEAGHLKSSAVPQVQEADDCLPDCKEETQYLPFSMLLHIG